MRYKRFVGSLAVATTLLLAANEAAAQSAGKQDICHFDADAGRFFVINISRNAVAQHTARHGDVLPGAFFADVDGDGYGNAAGATDACPNTGFVNNDDDAFPTDPTEHADSDGDGVGDNADAFPLDPSETTDSDGDGVGDNSDAFPFNPSETTDSDGDGIGDNGDDCPSAAGLPELDGCPAPVVTLGSDLVIGKSGEFGHPSKMAMLFGDGAGGFTKNEVGVGTYENFEVLAADVNHDGKDDVVGVDAGGKVYVGLGKFLDGLQFSDLVLVGVFTEGPGNCCNRTRAAQLGDVNNDGNLDIVVTQWTKLGVMLGNGNGTFSTPLLSGATSWDTRAMALGDFDADGNLDLVAHVAGNCCYWLAVHRGNGNGTFQAGTVIPNSTNTLEQLFTGDADGDGDLDIYSGAGGARLKIFTNNGLGSFTKTDIEPGANQGRPLVVDDFNGDAIPDVVARIEANSYMTVRVYLSNGSGGFTTTDHVLANSVAVHGVVADVNADGKKDLAIVAPTYAGSGIVWTLVGNGDGTFQSPSPAVVGYRGNYTIAAGNFGQ